MLEVQKKKDEEEKSDAACSSSIAALTRQENRGYYTNFSCEYQFWNLVA
jgi:hypothetical protein